MGMWKYQIILWFRHYLSIKNRIVRRVISLAVVVLYGTIDFGNLVRGDIIYL